MNKREIIDIANIFRENIISLLNFDNVFLYGAQAKNVAHEHCDIDIAVIVETFN